MDIVYLNGQFIPKEKATVSVMDRGFLFADSIYEVIPAYHSKLICGLRHFERLQNSLNNIFMNNPFENYTAFKDMMINLIKANQLENKICSLYIQITRGSEPQRQHRIPTDIVPTVVAFCMPLHPKTQDQLEKGFKAITHDDERHDRNFIKSTTLLTSVMLYEKALDQGAIETILLRDGKVLECTQSNLFIVKDKVIKTPVLAKTILAGVTRSLILEFAKEHGIPAQETDITLEELNHADEIWVTGSTKEICPIVQLNDQRVADGKVGKMWRQFNTLYQQFKESCI